MAGRASQAEAAPAALEPFEDSLKLIDFKMESMSAHCVEGRFIVSEKSCQPFGVLHGGVSALVAESLASSGALFAAGYRRVAGVQLTINHLNTAPIGTEILASAKPVQVGKRLQVWDVLLSKVDGLAPSVPEVSQSTRIALARVILMVDRSGPVMEVDERGWPRARL